MQTSSSEGMESMLMPSSEDEEYSRGSSRGGSWIFFLGGGGGQSMTVVECVRTERADFCILPYVHFTIYSKHFMMVANSNAG